MKLLSHFGLFETLPGSSIHGIFQARILEWVVHFLLQGIVPTWGSNPGLLNCRQTLYCLSHQGISPTWLFLGLLCVCICVHAHSVTSDYLQHLWPLCVVFDHITASTLNHKKLSAETTLFLVITGHFHIKQALDKLLLILCVLSHVWLCNPIDCSPPGSSVHGIS